MSVQRLDKVPDKNPEYSVLGGWQPDWTLSNHLSAAWYFYHCNWLLKHSVLGSICQRGTDTESLFVFVFLLLQVCIYVCVCRCEPGLVILMGTFLGLIQLLVPYGDVLQDPTEEESVSTANI